MKITSSFRLCLLICLIISTTVDVTHFARASSASEVSVADGFPRTEPGGIHFAGPLIADMDGDGSLDVLVADSGGCIWGWNAAGNPLPNFPLKPFGACSISRRINSIAVGNIDGDAALEVVAGTAGEGEANGQRGKVFAWNSDGGLISGWPKEMAWNAQYGNGQPEVYTVAVANISGDGALEVLAGTSNNSSQGGTEDEPTPNLYAWYGNGRLLPGYPTWYRRAGVYGLLGAGDLNNDRCMEVLAPRDHRWLQTYNSAGQALGGWPVESWVDPASATYYLSFTRNAPSFADLEGDGKVEIIIAGTVKRTVSSGGSEGEALNSAVMVLNPNGSRPLGWGHARMADGPPLADPYQPSQAPAIADLDNNGQLEIIVTLMDGTARAYKANGDLLWKYNFARGNRLFASEPVIGDINGDGRLDVVFGTYSPDGSADSAVGLLALNHNGNLLPGFPLGLTHEDGKLKGIRAAPALADLDRDGKVNIIVGALSGTVYVWNMTGSYDSRWMPWPTARHDNQRTGYYPRSAAAALETSDVTASDLVLAPIQAYLPLTLMSPPPATQNCP